MAALLPGPSGCTTEMVYVLTRDRESVTGLCALIRDITNGALPSSVKPYLLCCSVIGLDKNAGTGVWPIAMGEVFMRLARRLALSLVTAAATDHTLLSHQLGAGVPGACEAIIHNVQHALELQPTALTWPSAVAASSKMNAQARLRRALMVDAGSSQHCDITDRHPVRLPQVAFAIDLKNAFNSVSRRKALEQLSAHPQLQAVWRLVHLVYSEPTNLYICSSMRGQLTVGLQSCQGVRQGDPLSSLLLAVVLQPALNSSLQAKPGAALTAHLDDTTVVCDPHLTPDVYASIVHQASSIGLTVQPQKCQLVYFHNVAHPLARVPGV